MIATVYVYSDADGAPLYVGVTSRGARRQREHRKFSAWWPSIASATFEHFADYDLALIREAELIRELQPQHNRRVAGFATVDELQARRECVQARKAHPVRARLAANLRASRMSAGLSQEDIARATGCTPSTVQRWESAENAPRPVSLARLCSVLDRPIEWFYGDTDVVLDGEAA